MSIFKKLLALSMAAVLFCSAAACSGAGKAETAPAETTAQTAAPQAPAAEPPAATETGMRTVVDATGEEIQVPADPKAIVIIGPVSPTSSSPCRAT